jgi:hypothetical protein
LAKPPSHKQRIGIADAKKKRLRYTHQSSRSDPVSQPLLLYLSDDGSSMSNDTQRRQLLYNNIDKNNNDNATEVTVNAYTGTFGDIMSPKSDDADVLFRDGLVTSESYSLAQVYGIHHPLDRIAVTANGNLQRLFSSYYDAPVNVVVEHCRQSSQNLGEWNRRVHLTVFDDKTFCTADSIVQLHNPDCRALVESGKVGLGQLFRYQNVLPEFILKSAGPTEQGGFWRNYTLECSFMTCHIHEVFCPNVWNLSPREPRQEEKQ